MAFTTRVLSTVVLAVMVGGGVAQAQREDSYRWYLGVQSGGMFFETPTQTSGGIATVGIQALIVAKRTGLLLSVEEGFGSNESSGFSDFTAPGNLRQVRFNDIRRYSAVLMALPSNGPVQPFFGLGAGILQVVSPQVEGVFASPFAANIALDEAKSRGSTGFATLLGGLQFELARGVVGFGQYQVTTSPSDGKLFVSATHTVSGGLRFSLGSAREGVRGGGY